MPDENKPSLCPNCGQPGPHYVPPSCGDPGFFACEALNRKPGIPCEKQGADPEPPLPDENKKREKELWAVCKYAMNIFCGSELIAKMQPYHNCITEAEAKHREANAAHIVDAVNYVAGMAPVELQSGTAVKHFADLTERLRQVEKERDELRAVVENARTLWARVCFVVAYSDPIGGRSCDGEVTRDAVANEMEALLEADTDTFTAPLP